MPKRPHILIFNPDQWRGDVIGHLGNAGAVTPNLDALAGSDAVSFRWAFCQSPVCTPSRCSFMTGWYPHVRGHRTQFHMLHPERGEPNLLRALKDSGYFVWWGGKNDMVPIEGGYEPYCNVKFRAQPRMADLHEAQGWRGPADGDNYYSFYAGRLEKGDQEIYLDSDWCQVLGAIEQIRQAPADRPLCLYLPLGYPHPPYGVEEPYYGMIDPASIPGRIPTPRDWTGKPSMLKAICDRQGLRGWTEDRWRELRRTYYGMCARVDAQFGLIVRALKEAGLYDETAIFFFSDHGDYTGDYGLVEKNQNTFGDSLSRVPFLIKPPAGVAVRPRVSDALVELIDFTATAYEWAEIEPGYSHFGRSLSEVVAGRTDEVRDAVFCEGGRRHGERQCMELESAHDQASAGLYWPRVALQASEGPEHTKAIMCRTRDFKYVQRLYETHELYDLRKDPGEQHNVIAELEYAAVLARMKERLLRHHLETADVVPWQIDPRY